MKLRLSYYIQKFFALFLSRPLFVKGNSVGFSLIRSEKYRVKLSENTRINAPFYLHQVNLGAYSYIAKNSSITNTEIGKFTSIGPNFSAGLGIHPTNGISTSPMFYSTAKQNGITLTKKNKIEESKLITIGNDVFIGANVTVLDGVTIGDGSVIGAGAVVTKDIPPYAIAVGVPAKVVKYRFEYDQIEQLQEIEWWDFDQTRLREIEGLFFDLNIFIEKYSK